MIAAGTAGAAGLDGQGGWSNAEIGERLHMAAAAAKTHVSRLLMKLDPHDRVQLVMIAHETRLVVPS